jgi:uncharacterized protein (DUF983 family)
MTKPSNNRTLFRSIVMNKCPRCRTGNLFTEPNPYNLRKMMLMPERCLVCNHRFEEQPAFFFGTGYVSYALTVAFSITTFILWYKFIGISTRDNRLLYWFITNALLMLLLQPILQRLSRSIWLAFFVRYDPDWNAKASKTEG